MGSSSINRIKDEAPLLTQPLEGSDENTSIATDEQNQTASSNSPNSQDDPLHISNYTAISEPTDSLLRREYHRILEAHLDEIRRDKADVEENLIRERKFTVEYNKLSRNKIWANEEGPECHPYMDSPEEFMHHTQEIWPRGRDLNKIHVFCQMWDFFFFMWAHTKPYKTVAVILLMSLTRPIQVASISYVAAAIENDPRAVPLWLYFAGFYGHVLERFMYWWYEMWVPLNSQRVQFRCVLLKKRVRLPHDHPMAVKWSSGRFPGLLKDVDDVVNSIWNNQLSMFDDLVSMLYLLVLCFVQLATSVEENLDSNAYAVYVAVFVGLGMVTMVMPYVWFWLLDGTMQQCETMIRDGQALYMSASNNRVVSNGDLLFESLIGENVDTERRRKENETASKSYWLYGRTTFRAFFHRLAWQTNYSLFTHAWAPIAAYILLTEEGFGASFGTQNILIILLSLRDLNKLSVKLLEYLMSMSRGCNTLRDVADLLNAKVDDPALDLEMGLDKSSVCESNISDGSNDRKENSMLEPD